MGIQYCVKQDVKPYAFLTLRRFPLLLKSQVEQKLRNIRKVDTPMEWCAGMVAKSKLNNNVCCECHILLSVKTLAQLLYAKIFAKLNARSSLWQIKFLKSALLTTFTHPWKGLFNRLPFCITSA